MLSYCAEKVFYGFVYTFCGFVIARVFLSFIFGV